jgi:hypothetical protein
MYAAHFDCLVLTLTRARTRRSVLGLLAALGLTGLVARDTAAQTCLANGQRCGGGRGTCCSGRCVRKRGTNRKFCRPAPNQGTCTIENDVCDPSTTPLDCSATSSAQCLCYMTTRGYSFCAVGGASFTCFACETNADCEQRPAFGQPGDRCVQCPGCGGTPSGRGCVHECPTPATA